MINTPLVLPLDRAGIKDIAIVGGKCASLGEMIRNLASVGVAVPKGFAITTEVYYRFLAANRLQLPTLSCKPPAPLHRSKRK